MAVLAPEQALAAFFLDSSVKQIGVAVSGGSDSTALLLLAQDWAHENGAQCFAATVDHGLRSEAADEAAQVADLCAAWDVPHETLTWRGWSGAGNVQAAARAARYDLLAGWGAENDLDIILIGHTVEDQAETFLIRLSRSAGVDGLSAMEPRFSRKGQAFGRPILHCHRDDLRTLLRDRGIGWIDDPSNDNVRFDRVRARQALGHLEDLGISPRVLSEVSANLKDARKALDTQLSQVCAAHVTQDRGDLVVPLAALTDQPREIARRFLSTALCWVSGEPYAPRRAALLQRIEMLDAGQGGTLHGCLLTVAKDVLRISREYNAVADLTSAAPVWDDRWRCNGPWEAGLTLRATGEDGLAQRPDWREFGLPRSSALAAPSVWRGETLVSAPFVEPPGAWTVTLLPEKAQFPSQTQ